MFVILIIRDNYYSWNVMSIILKSVTQFGRRIISFTLCVRGVSEKLPLNTGLCDVGEFKKSPPGGTKAQL